MRLFSSHLPITGLRIRGADRKVIRAISDDQREERGIQQNAILLVRGSYDLREELACRALQAGRPQRNQRAALLCDGRGQKWPESPRGGTDRTRRPESV